MDIHLIGHLTQGVAKPAAYLDPGSGGFLLQLLLAGLLGIAVALRASWSRIKVLFTRKKNKDSGNDEIE